MAKPLVTLIVEHARALIDNPATWCQGTFAFLADGRRCSAHEAGAVRFCAYGALQRAAFEVAGKRAVAEELTQKAATAITGRTAARARALIIQTNDCQGRAAVLRLFNDYLAAPPPAKEKRTTARRQRTPELVH